MKEHHYNTKLEWTGNQGSGTSDYKSYSRDHVASIDGKLAPISMASDPSFRGDPSRYNPEELLVTSLSSCHMLWYLHLCAVNGVIVTAYSDNAEGTMTETANGGGQFSKVTLKPKVTVANAEKAETARDLHHKANELCFIANSCNFPVEHQPEIVVESEND